MTTEAEIISQHQASLRQARERCLILQKNQVEPRPSFAHHIALLGACKRLEGTCRQMGHMRGDARWFRLATLYMGNEATLPASRTGVEARTQRSAGDMVNRLYNSRNWAGFGQLAELFERGMRQVDELATRQTERKGTLILPPWMMQ